MSNLSDGVFSVVRLCLLVPARTLKLEASATAMASVILATRVLHAMRSCQTSSNEDVEPQNDKGTLRELVFLLVWVRRAVCEGSRTGAFSRLCPLLQAEWLQKTAGEIKEFEVEQALCDVSCLSFESALLSGT